MIFTNPDRRRTNTMFIKMAEEPRSYVGRIESVERHSERPGSRYTIIIDAADVRIDLKAAKSDLNRERGNLAILRVMTTADKFARMAQLASAADGDGAENLAGRWVELRLVPPGTESGPRAQVCLLGDTGYEDIVVYTVAEIIEFGFNPLERPPSGRTHRSTEQLVTALYFEGLSHKARQLPRPTAHNSAALHKAMSSAQIAQVIVHDVGHANFTTLLDVAGRPVLHFDAGWPLGFNRKTCPPKALSINFAPIVVLSHWDWDHLHGFHKWQQVRDAFWFVPEQHLGPGAKLVSDYLEAKGRLTVYAHQPGFQQTYGDIRVIGADPSLITDKSKRRNNSGISMVIDLKAGGRILLPGDADYVVTGAGISSDLLVVSHHGAEISGAPPLAAKGNPRAVVSMGLGNCYQHHSAASLAAHGAKGWILEFTSGAPSGANSVTTRGDRKLP